MACNPERCNCFDGYCSLLLNPRCDLIRDFRKHGLAHWHATTNFRRYSKARFEYCSAGNGGSTFVLLLIPPVWWNRWHAGFRLSVEFGSWKLELRCAGSSFAYAFSACVLSILLVDNVPLILVAPRTRFRPTTQNRQITIRCTRSRGPRGFYCLQVDRRGPVIVDVIPLTHH